jgi:hypothetical protein
MTMKSFGVACDPFSTRIAMSVAKLLTGEMR